MGRILDIVNGWITAAVSGGTSQMKQVLLFIFIAGSIALVIWKIRGIIALANEVRNSKLNELQRFLDSHELSDEASTCIKEDIKRIISYCMTGISDVTNQKVILRLFVENRDSTSAGLFKKFRTSLLIKDGVLVFKKGFSFWFEDGMYASFSFHFLLIAALSLILSIYRHERIPVWGHLILYSAAVVMFLFFITFGKMIPRPEECNLLNKILQTQYNDSSE